MNKIRILVCHLLYSIGCPLNRDQLIEITSLEQAVNYFDLMEALDGITGRLCTCQEVYTRDEIKKDSLVSVRYAEHENGTCTIGVTIKSEKTGRQKYYLTISAADKTEADSIKKRIQRNPENFRQYLESYFESGTEG